jgi:thiol-disulfide isomerase/thioredoxin
MSFKKNQTNTRRFKRGGGAAQIEQHPNNLYNNNPLIKELTPADFSSDSKGNIKILNTQGKMGFVVFYADWCGHCKNMVQEYTQLAQSLAGCIKSGVVFTNVFNCNNGGLYEEISKQCDVNGYPTIKFINITGAMVPYNGGRTVNDFLKFLAFSVPKICDCASGVCKK